MRRCASLALSITPLVRSAARYCCLKVNKAPTCLLYRETPVYVRPSLITSTRRRPCNLLATSLSWSETWVSGERSEYWQDEPRALVVLHRTQGQARASSAAAAVAIIAMEADQRYANLPPIPTYDEAISARPAQDHRGPQEVSDDAERQGLLGQPGLNAHRPPTVESARSSEESDLGLPEVVFGEDEEEDEHRRIEELDYLDPADSDPSRRQRGVYHRARLRRNLTKHLANISATFSSIRLPSFRSFYSPVNSTTGNSSDDEPASTDPPAPPRSLWRHPYLVIPDQYRMSLPIFARLCGLLTIAAVIYVLFALDMFPGTRPRMGAHYDPEAVQAFVKDSVKPERIKEYLRHITSYDHVAGTEGDYYLASWMQEQWMETAGFDEVAILDYHVYLNYPTHEGRSVRIVEPEGKRWKAQLEENLVDPLKQQTLVYHGHSRSGEATGHLIYANGGSRDDFKWLKENGVETEGAIALVRYYASQEDAALKIKAAHEVGCAGVLIYSDPADDGAGKGEVWPDGPWRPADSVQRGGVGLTSLIIGDPLTPGWASKKNSKTVSKASSYALPQIPSLPMPWRDAQILIDALQGQGVEVPPDWVGGTNGDGAWFSGKKGGTGAVQVELRNNNDENEKQQIWNVHGLIQGLEQAQEKVIIGNHRDSWCFGAVDPGSGSAVMMEVIDIFSALRMAGWRPLRSIEFVSWDAKEFNLMGSTEYVEERSDYLRDHGIAYLNVDAGVYGSNFHAAGSPLFQKPLLHVLSRVDDSVKNGTLRHIWDEESNQLGTLSAAGDHVAFQSIAGTSSIDFGFRGPPHAFPYHSCYETFDWMEKFGDPDFSYHRTLAQVWALLILELADRPLIPFNLVYYSRQIESYIHDLEQTALNLYTATSNDSSTTITPDRLNTTTTFSISPLLTAAQNLTQQAQTFQKFEDEWSRSVRWAGGLESPAFSARRLDYNERIARFETDLLDLPAGKHDKGQHGIPGREQFKHIVWGPRVWSNGQEGSNYFPAVRDLLDEGDWVGAMEMVKRAAGILERAGRRLVEE